MAVVLTPTVVHALADNTGGWAGGEAGLWQLREQVQREKAAKKAGGAASSSNSDGKVQPPAPKGGLQPIYVGYSKE